MKKIRIKAKPKCHCEDHYLELCTSFDGHKFTYQRYCYKCGKTWHYTDYLSGNCKNVYDVCISNSIISATGGSTIAVSRMELAEGTIMFIDGTQYCYVYALNEDGTCGDLIRMVEH